MGGQPASHATMAVALLSCLLAGCSSEPLGPPPQGAGGSAQEGVAGVSGQPSPSGLGGGGSSVPSEGGGSSVPSVPAGGSPAAPPPDLAVHALALGDGMFVAVGSEGSYVEQPGGGSRFLGPRTIYASPDGIDWSRVYAGADGWFDHVAAGNGRYLAVTSRGENPYFTVAFHSEDAITWREVSMPGSGGEVVFGNGVFVAIDRWKDCFYTSTDTETWDTVPWPDCFFVDGLAFAAGRFVATCGERVFASENGSDWELTSYAGWGINEIYSLGDRFIAITDGSEDPHGILVSGLAMSLDGLSWELYQDIDFSDPIVVPIWSGSAGCIGVISDGNAGEGLVSGADCSGGATGDGWLSTMLSTPDAFFSGWEQLQRTTDGLNWDVVLQTSSLE